MTFPAPESSDLSYRPVGTHLAWLLSYADITTILLTFMVLLLSVSTMAQSRFDILVEAFTGQQVSNLREVQRRIEEVVAHQGLEAEVTTTLDEKGLAIEFESALLFPSGNSEITQRAQTLLDPIATHIVQDLEAVYGLVIEGYTDDVPIATERYRSNWELSASRAIHVMERIAAAGFPQARMSVQGFADTRAADGVNLNDAETVKKLTPQELAAARAINRRVIIRIDRLGGGLSMGRAPVKPTKERVKEDPAEPAPNNAPMGGLP